MLERTSLALLAKGLTNPSRVFVGFELLLFVADELNDGHLGTVTGATTELDDAQITAGPRGKAIGDVARDFLECRDARRTVFVRLAPITIGIASKEITGDLPRGVQRITGIAVLARFAGTTTQRDGLFGERT